MAILKIAKMGNPVLRAHAQEVPDPTSPQIHALISDMVETMLDARGAGLAAPQVHVPLRIVIFHEPKEIEEPEDADGAEEPEEPEDFESAGVERERGPLHILVNPVIEPLSEETAFDWEGCLSVPQMRGLVPRFTRIRYSGLGLDGNPIAREAEGFHARVVQHECDHLDGILYPQRMTDLRLLGFTEEFDRHPLEFAPDETGDDEEDAPDGQAGDGQAGDGQAVAGKEEGAGGA